jgi:hypothetical protein
MTEPVAPEVAQAAVQDTVAENAASVAPQTEVPSGEDLAAVGAAPAAVDVDALLALIQKQADAVKALQDEVAASRPVPAEPEKPVRVSDTVADNASGWLRNALTTIEDRLEAVEVHAGLRDAPEDTGDGAS